MNKSLKLLILVIICAAALFLVLNYYGNSASSGKAVAFEWEKEVNIYLSNSEKGSLEECSLVFPVSRTVFNAETLGPGALEALLKGPTEEEQTESYQSNIPENTLLQRFEIVEGVAYIDFNPAFIEGVAGSCLVTAIRAQIESTLVSLPDIDAVIISVDGETENVLQP